MTVVFIMLVSYSSSSEDEDEDEAHDRKRKRRNNSATGVSPGGRKVQADVTQESRFGAQSISNEKLFFSTE